MITMILVGQPDALGLQETPIKDRTVCTFLLRVQEIVRVVIPLFFPHAAEDALWAELPKERPGCRHISVVCLVFGRGTEEGSEKRGRVFPWCNGWVAENQVLIVR